LRGGNIISARECVYCLEFFYRERAGGAPCCMW